MRMEEDEGERKRIGEFVIAGVDFGVPEISCYFVGVIVGHYSLILILGNKGLFLGLKTEDTEN